MHRIPVPAAELEELLSESPSAARAREATEFDRLAGGHSTAIVLFGARKMGRLLLEGLRQTGIEPLAFSDNDPTLWGQTIDGVEIRPPGEAAQTFGGSSVFVIAGWGRGSSDPMREREAGLRSLGCQYVAPVGPLFWKYPRIFLPRIPATDLPHKVLEQAGSVREAFSLLADERSRVEFVAQLRWRLHFDFDALPDPGADPIYFPQGLIARLDEEVFVDVGAYDGDTLRSFLRQHESRFGRIIAFEPDPISLDRLRRTVTDLPEVLRGRIRIVAAATGARQGSVRFSAAGAPGSRMDGGEAEVPCVKLDDALAEDSPTYIKMDIEAAEPDALVGAAGLIGRHAPVLAIAGYHRQEHLWKLPCLIYSLNPRYRIFLRPHIQLVEDLVCYAVPPERLDQPRPGGPRPRIVYSGEAKP